MITIIETIVSLFNSTGAGGNSFGGACCSCISTLIRDLRDTFSRYALSYAAIYGTDFNTSAKTLFGLISTRGVRLIVNELLVDRILSVGGLIVGLINVGIHTTNHSYCCNLPYCCQSRSGNKAWNYSCRR